MVLQEQLYVSIALISSNNGKVNERKGKTNENMEETEIDERGHGERNRPEPSPQFTNVKPTARIVLHLVQVDLIRH